MPEIHVKELLAGPVVGMIYIWLDNDEMADGVLIGAGSTKREAIDLAIEELHAHIIYLESLRTGTAA